MALQARYQPKVFRELANLMVREVAGGYLEISDVLEDISDAYEKLGHMFYAEKTMKELDPETPYFALVIQYHVLSFIFYCKAFLDSISNAIYHAFDLDIEKVVNIDLTREEFEVKLAKANPNMAGKIRPFLNWAKYITEYRMALIHKYRFFSMSLDLTFSRMEILREPINPLDFFDKEKFDAFQNEVKHRHGSLMVAVDDFCREALDNAESLFETIISQFLKYIRCEGSDVFGWERIQPSHIGELTTR